MKTLILYATTDGHTKTVANFLAAQLVKNIYASNNTSLMALSNKDKHTAINTPVDISIYNIEDFVTQKATIDAYDMVIFGASIRYGNFKKIVYSWLKQNQSALQQKFFAFFTVNLTARKPGKDVPSTNTYLLKLYKGIGYRPDVDAVFAGRIAYPIYRWYDKRMIQLIMKITDGPTDTSTVKVYTDWQKVAAFASNLLLKYQQRVLN